MENNLFNPKIMNIKRYFTIYICFISLYTYSQVGIGTGTHAKDDILEIKSNSKGFLLPRLSTAERDAIVSPTTGLTIFNATTICLEWFNELTS